MKIKIIITDNRSIHWKTKTTTTNHSTCLSNKTTRSLFSIKQTYKSRWIIISRRFSITERLEYRVRLNNLIFKGHSFLHGWKRRCAWIRWVWTGMCAVFLFKQMSYQVKWWWMGDFNNVLRFTVVYQPQLTNRDELLLRVVFALP